MTYLPPFNGGRINASIGGNTAGAGSLVSSGTLTLVGGNNITLSQAGNAVTISGGAGGGVALYDGANSISSGTARLSAVGALTASINGQTLSLSVPTMSSISATGALSISNNGATVSMGVPAVSFGMSNIGNTSGTSGTASNQMIFAGGNNITLSQSTAAGGNTLSISAANQSVQTQNLHNITLGGNTTGTLAQISSGTLSLAGGNNITLSQAGNAITISGGAGGAGLSAGTQSVGSGTVNFANSNGITFGMSGSSQLTASHNGITSQSNQTIGLYAASNTTQNSSTVLDARSLSFQGAGAASVGYSNGSVVISAPNAAAGSITFSAGGSSNGLASVVFSNSNGVSFGLNGSTITASAAGGGGGGIALANSQTTYTSGTANLAVAGGAMTIASTTGQSYNFSVPQTSSLSATGALSLYSTGGTISIGAPVVSFGMSNIGNTSGTSGTASNQMIFAGGNNITLSQATGSGGNTLSIVGGSSSLVGTNGISISTTSSSVYVDGSALRIRRVGSTTSSATPTINTNNYDTYQITALATNITSFTINLSGTPSNGQTLWITITDNGTSRSLAWGSSFEASTISLPNATTISTRLDVGFIWNSSTSKWRCVAVA